MRSETRGREKPGRRNCDGKLTGEAGPTLGIGVVIHRGYVGGLVEIGMVFQVSARSDEPGQYVVVSGEEVSNCLGGN